MHCSSPVREPGAITELPLLSEGCQGVILLQLSLQSRLHTIASHQIYSRKRPFQLISISILLKYADMLLGGCRHSAMRGQSGSW